MDDFKQNEHVVSLKQTLKLIDQSNESTRTLVNKALKLIELLDEVLQKSEFKRITNERLLQTCDEEVEQLKQFTELVVKDACAGKMVMKPYFMRKGIRDHISWDVETLDSFFKIHNIVPNWINEKGNRGKYNYETGKWTGSLGRVIYLNE